MGQKEIGQLMQQQGGMQRSFGGGQNLQRPGMGYGNHGSPHQPGGIAQNFLRPGQSPLMGGGQGGMQGGSIGYQPPGGGMTPGAGGRMPSVPMGPQGMGLQQPMHQPPVQPGAQGQWMPQANNMFHDEEQQQPGMAFAGGSMNRTFR